ncbi:MAG: DUF1971 domain-containing protein [Gammaproteobacteria bacterium]|nr:DUF1971 domain-containing protein [Gammaproteobacteria bacterium]
MKKLPSSVVSYKKTPTFSQDTIPAGILKAHQTKAGTWGKIVILEGELLYRILEPSVEEVSLCTDTFGVVEPQILHQVEPLGKVSFYVEFLR